MNKIKFPLLPLVMSFKKSNSLCRVVVATVLLLLGTTASFAQNLTQSGFTSVLTPQYMGSGNTTRLPVMFRATVTGLTSNTTYRYFVQAATTSDFGGSNPGAGNPLMINSTGTTYTYSTGASLTSSGDYSTFTTNASGSFTGWFGFVNTSNARFTAGNLVYPTIVIGSNSTGSTLHRRALDVSINVLAYSTSAGANNGSFLKEVTSNATAKNLVAIYDNETGTGRPLYIAPVESIGTSIASLISGYSTTGGSWNAIIPNNNANGVKRIEQRSVTTGNIIGCATDANGVWPTGSVNTVDPRAGTGGLSIAAADASLTSCCSTITVTATPGTISCNGGTTSVTVGATGGTAPYTGTGTFNAAAGTHTYTVTDANGCSGSTTITINQPTALSASSSATAILCAGGSSTVTVSAAGGTAPYTGAGTFTVPAGTHEFTVTDANGCTATTSITVNEPAVLQAAATAPSIGCTETTTTVTVSATGGTAPYTGTGAFTLGAGTHEFTVTDANGCTTTTSITVTVEVDNTLPTITAPAAINVNANEGCTAIAVNLGTPVTADNCTVASVTNDAPAAFPLGATTVTWTVTDGNGNIATAAQIVTVADTTKPVIYLQGSHLLAGVTGSSTVQSPYLRPSIPGVKLTSIVTVNDVVGGYRMAGLPDGLGAFDNGDGTFTVVMNHEIGNTLGAVRAHGSRGAFVSKWIINKSDLSVVSGSDLMQQVYLWNPATSTFGLGTLAFSRFCSADLPPVSAFYNHVTGLGTRERIFMNGEESGVEGKALGHIITGPNGGTSYELPYLGKFAWENSVASPSGGDKTIVAGLDDGTGGQVYIYVGTKTNTGSEIEKAGLHNGKLYGVKVTGYATETNGSLPAAGTRFELFDHGFVQNTTGATLNTASVAAGVTTFLRPEDGAWDPSHPNDFYFVSTNAFNSPSRLWRLRFDNILAPETGGTIEALLDGTEGGQMLDNISVDKFGNVHLQEDVGNNVHIGKLWRYSIAGDSLIKVAHHDSTRFITGAPNFLTQDEEASGIIDMSEILGPGIYLTTSQAHFAPAANTAEVVEGGQLLAMLDASAIGTSTAADTIRIYSGCAASIDLGTPATADNCSVASVTNNAPATFPLGTTIVTWTVTDGSGNTATIDQVIIVTDTTAPSITAPASVNANTNEGCTATNVNLGSPVISENCAIASIINDAPAAFPLGTTTVTWTVTDSSGNIATATQTVTVTDNTNPVIYLQASNLLAGITGSSTVQSPYLRPSIPGVKLTSIVTVNDVVGGYRMVGIPDGLGAFDNGDGTFTVVMNHELGNTLGAVRAHGSRGAFVSKWIINKSDLSAVSGSDLMQQVYLWNPATSTFGLGTLAFSRFCSADLPPVSAFYNHATGNGTRERIFMNGEESGVEGKAVGHIITGPNGGTSYELPYLGKFAWENSVASPSGGEKTIVAGLDDGTGGQVYIYVGTKTNTGSEIEKAGLHNGKLYGVKVTGYATETNGSIPAAGTRFELFDHGFVQNTTGATLNTASVAAGVTTFLRPEDGAWDPSHPNDFYFVSTNAFNSPSRLWRLRFDNILAPETGGTIEALLDGTEGGQMLDNISVDKFGNVHLQEDVGNNVHIGKLWRYSIAGDSLIKVAHHDSTRFITGAPNFLTQDEEASGIIDMSEILGPGMYLSTVQAHFAPAANTAEVVEGGQLLAMLDPGAIGVSTARDTIRVTTSGTSATVDLGTPAAADNCSVASVNNNAPANFPVGTTIVTWTVTDGNGNTASVDQVVIVTSVGNQPPIVDITSPANDTTYPAGSTITLNVNATDPDGTVVKVEFYDGAGKFGEDLAAPFTITGENVEPGEYVLTAKAFDNNGDSTVSDTVRITVTACTGEGFITAEGYTNINGDYLINLGSDPDYPNNPDVVTQLNKLEYGPNLDDNYGGRLRGYICVPQTGDYIFYIASDDQSELWLSTDENPANIRRIAWVPISTGFRSWFENGTQRSVSIRLIKGARYYIETLHKAGTGTDHLSVAWRLPNGVFEAPIAGSRLSPVSSSAPLITGVAPEFGEALRNASSEQDGIANGKLVVTAIPNPSPTSFRLRTKTASSETLVITVTDVLGRVVEKRAQVAPNTTLQIGERLLTGIYFVEVIQGTQRERIKLVKQ